MTHPMFRAHALYQYYFMEEILTVGFMQLSLLKNDGKKCRKYLKY